MAKNKKNVNDVIVEEEAMYEEVVEINETGKKQKTKIEPDVVETKEAEEKIETFVKSSTNKFDNIKEVLNTNMTFEEKMKACKKIDKTLSDIITIFEKYQDEYLSLKENNKYLNEKDISSTVNLYSAIKYLLSPTDNQDFKISVELLIEIVKNYRTQSLSPINYASGLEKWTGDEEDADEFLSIMHTIHTIIIDGHMKASRLINFSKFKHGQKLFEYINMI